MSGPDRRPKDTVGNRLKVITNMYPMQLHPDRVIYLNKVEIVPELSATAHRRNYELFDILQTKLHPQAFTPRAAYDGSRIMLSTVQYPWGAYQEFNVLTSRKRPPPPPGEKGHFIVKISANRSFPIASLANYMRLPNSIPPDEIVNYINVFLRMAPMQMHAFRGNNFYVTQGHKLIGFFQSVRATVSGPMVNMDVTSSVLWVQRPLVDTILNFLRLSDPRELALLPAHRPGAQPKVIRGFDKRGAHAIRLDEHGPTVEDYLLDKYNRRLKHPQSLCVSLSNRKQDILPVELLVIDANQFFDLKKLDNLSWDKQIKEFAMIKPSDRLAITNSGSNAMGHAQSDYVQRAGIRVNSNPLSLEGRIRDPAPVLYPKDARETIEQLLHKVAENMKQRFKRPPSLLLIFTPGETEWYTAVKRFGDITLGIPTQHLRTDKALGPRGNADYCQNVALKSYPTGFDLRPINVKLGGINFVPHSGSIQWIRGGEPLMVIGADTSHPRPGEGYKPTIAAISFSVDQNVSKYNGVVGIQRGKQEIIGNLVGMVKSAIARFKMTGPTPKRILYYRDGVGERMYEEVVREECEAIRQAFREVNEANPKITAIVVGKRHHVRLYAENPRDADQRSGNVNPGLVVDHTITSPPHDDFYLLAHQGIIGTSRPMHCIPIVDDNHLSSDLLQTLTFALTHNYQRATRSVSIPAPIYYADILCSPERARVHFDPSKDFSDSGSGSQHPTGQQYQQAFKPLASGLRDKMFWM
ncbi:Piwi-domain-containing protein [Dacryopinax primogenitus]|uniref:Piwi-domain-containing protein n=1 Tax=Dacryopinax primogenitus (strain DJM 731) TaxID=1858805 RepID=M5FW90_DACPD|nr:Piwi-domain-containing protein [Dacryopinax primogenitus]EJU02151.1 Piwi-domain-containing protein [Dacryopinax primogenitus]